MRTYSFSVYLQDNGRMCVKAHSGQNTDYVKDAILIGVDELAEYVSNLISKKKEGN